MTRTTLINVLLLHEQPRGAVRCVTPLTIRSLRCPERTNHDKAVRCSRVLPSGTHIWHADCILTAYTALYASYTFQGAAPGARCLRLGSAIATRCRSCMPRSLDSSLRVPSCSESRCVQRSKGEQVDLFSRWGGLLLWGTRSLVGLCDPSLNARRAPPLARQGWPWRRASRPRACKHMCRALCTERSGNLLGTMTLSPVGHAQRLVVEPLAAPPAQVLHVAPHESRLRVGLGDGRRVDDPDDEGSPPSGSIPYA